MTQITGAKLTVRKQPIRILFLALMGTAALGALAPSTIAARAETGGEPQVQYGTPKDLPVTLSGSYLAGRLAGVEKDFSQAAAFYEEALAEDPTNSVLLERTFLLKLANGNIEEAAQYAGELEKTGSRNFLGQLTLAAEAVKKGNYDDAVALLDANAGGPLADLSIGIARGWALYGAGHVDEALATIADLKGPDWFEVFKADHSALILYAAGRNEEALKQIEIAYKADQGAIRVVDTYARILAANGKKDEALKVLEDYDRLLKGHPLLAQTHERIENGTPLGPLAADPAEGISEILYGLGAAIGRDSAEELATAFLQLSLYLDPKAQFAAVTLGGLMERMGQPERAIEVLKMVPEEAALKRDAEIQIGLDYNSMDRLDEARKHLSALIEQDPTELEAIVSLGNVLRGHKIFDEAEVVYTKGIDSLGGNLQKEHWLLLYFRGICRERQGKWDLAEADFRKALDLFKDQPLVLNYLGYSLVDQGLKLDEALGMIKKAVKLRPTDGYIVDSLGWVYYRLGHYEEAVKELERAIELRPSDPVINDHLGDAYWMVGRKNEAWFQWNHARDLGPEPDDLPKILKKIANGLDDSQADAAKVGTGKNGG